MIKHNMQISENGNTNEIGNESKRLLSGLTNTKSVKLLVHPDKCRLEGSQEAFQKFTQVFELWEQRKSQQAQRLSAHGY